jgi:hypothetical protein
MVQGTTTSNFNNGVDAKQGYYVNGQQVINSSGEVVDASQGVKQYSILKPEVGTAVVVSAEDISGGDVATATLVRTILDYPRNLLYTLSDNASDTLEAIFTVVGTDQFGVTATEVVEVDFDASATVAGTQIFNTITSIAIAVTNEAGSDTASVGVAITADVASFGLPDAISAVTDVKGVNWIDNGTSKTQNIDSTSVVVARDAFRPEQTVATADDYIILYKST